MDCSLPGSSIHGILQAKILEWAAIPFSRGIFPTQRSNPGLPHCRWILYHLSHQGSPKWDHLVLAYFLNMYILFINVFAATNEKCNIILGGVINCESLGRVRDMCSSFLRRFSKHIWKSRKSLFDLMCVGRRVGGEIAKGYAHVHLWSRFNTYLNIFPGSIFGHPVYFSWYLCKIWGWLTITALTGLYFSWQNYQWLRWSVLRWAAVNPDD